MELLNIACHSIGVNIRNGEIRRKVYLDLFRWGDREVDGFAEMVDSIESEFDSDPAWASARDQIFDPLAVGDVQEISLTAVDEPVHRYTPNFG